MVAYSSSMIRNTLFYWQREARGSEAEIDYLSIINGIKISLADRSKFEKIVSIPLYAAFEIVEGGIERVQSLLAAS
jgi:hypothetical protein